MKKACIVAGLFVSGSPTWARTRDTRINSPLLYQLSYRGIEKGAIIMARSHLVNIRKQLELP
jgi:hypothetical protein